MIGEKGEQKQIQRKISKNYWISDFLFWILDFEPVRIFIAAAALSFQLLRDEGALPAAGRRTGETERAGDKTMKGARGICV